MSKRLNKRQQREQEELEQLRATQKQIEPSEQVQAEEEDEADLEETKVDVQEAGAAEPVNAFAALGTGEEDVEEGYDEEEDAPAVTTAKKSKKKKPKKKKKPATAVASDVEDESQVTPSTSTPAGKSKAKKGGKVDDGMDEVDRALAELDMKAGQSSTGTTGPTTVAAANAATASTLGLRQLLSVDPKNLDADAELRRFFGSKVISSSAATSKSHRPTASTKLRYTISKPKPTYPPATSLAGLGMREMTDEEVEDAHASRMTEWKDPAEKWFTFEHAGIWREITRQFLGATQSHDPNQLMALLQVYPWHVDTLLQMSEVYRLQSDIGAASDYAERALYALDRCLIPAFNVSSGACRIDFNAVENRPMFLAIHRIIAYLGRRGCWVTAFNFAKLLFSLDPMNDPHGSAFWLDFLAIKSGNHAWILSMFEEQSGQMPAAVFQGYPGMAFAYALACRVREDSQKTKDRTVSDQALREAILAFPQAVLPLADKIGANVPGSARTNPLLRIQAGYTKDPSCPIHLLSHIYASRSEALWKEAPMISWLTSIVASSLPDLNRADAEQSRQDVLRLIHTPRDPFDEQESVPLFICRHVVCSESTSFVGFLPDIITKRSISAFDPLPPLTAASHYDNDYFSHVQRTNRRRGGQVGTERDRGMIEEFMERVNGAMRANPTGWREELANGLRAILGGVGAQGADPRREEDLQRMLALADQVAGIEGDPAEEDGEAAGMPGAFPGAED